MVGGLIFWTAALAATQQGEAKGGSEPADQSTIVVTGRRESEQEIRDFVHSLTSLPSRRQLGRFEQSVCPVAVGLPRPQAELVASRMRFVADAAGIRVGSKGCVPNVVVAVTPDKRAFLRELRASHPDYFGSIPRQKARELTQETGPGTAWQLAGPPVSARGVELRVDPDLGVYVNRTTEAASRISAPARPQFDAAIVVVDRGALAGLTATQLADYAAMRAFTGADPARLAGSSASTILRILEAPMGTEVPSSLTHWDLGFLRGFYSSPRNLSNAAQRSAIRDGVADELRRREGK